MENITDRFIDILYRLSRQDIDARTYKHAKYVLLDYLGTAIYGSGMLRKHMEAYLYNFQDGRDRATVIGIPHKYMPYHAALLNGMAAHATEFDDGCRFGMIHLAAPIIPAVFAASENASVSGKYLLKGIIFGYEAAIRLSRSIQPCHKKKGYHTTATCGCIGAAIGAAVALGCDKKELKRVLSVAVTNSSGVLEIQEDASELKGFNAGMAAANGLMSAYIGKSGLAAPDDALGGKRGFFAVMSDRYCDEDKLLAVEDEYLIHKIYLKPYVSCRHCHPIVEGGIQIAVEEPLNSDCIKEILVYTYQLAVKGHEHKEIKNTSSAKLSIPFCLAISVLRKKCGTEEFQEKWINDKEVISLMDKITVLEDPELTLVSSERRSARVVIVLDNGIKYERTIEYPLGEPENPMTEEEIKSKFIALAKASVDTERVIESVFKIEMEFATLVENL